LGQVLPHRRQMTLLGREQAIQIFQVKLIVDLSARPTQR